MIRNGEAVWCIDCNVQSYESTKRARLHTVTNLRDSMTGLQEDMQELKEERKTIIININMLAFTSKEMPEDG